MLGITVIGLHCTVLRILWRRERRVIVRVRCVSLAFIGGRGTGIFGGLSWIGLCLIVLANSNLY